MDVRIQSVHFDASTHLNEFVNKKMAKLSKCTDDVTAAEVVLRVVKSDERANKEASVKCLLPDGELFASKQTDTFEEAIVMCVDALLKQLERYKEKKTA